MTEQRCSVQRQSHFGIPVAVFTRPCRGNVPRHSRHLRHPRSLASHVASDICFASAAIDRSLRSRFGRLARSRRRRRGQRRQDAGARPGAGSRQESTDRSKGDVAIQRRSRNRRSRRQYSNWRFPRRRWQTRRNRYLGCSNQLPQSTRHKVPVSGVEQGQGRAPAAEKGKAPALARALAAG